MRKLSFILILALLALVLGVFAFVLSRSRQPVAYCEVARNAERYHNKIIRVRATLIFSSEAMYIYEDCDPVEALASSVEFDGSDSDTRGYVEQLLVQPSDSSLKKVDAIIEGRFDGKFSMGCWGPKYHIALSKVELLTAVSDYVPPQTGEAGLRTKH
jgi:hypothetical protein